MLAGKLCAKEMSAGFFLKLGILLASLFPLEADTSSSHTSTQKYKRPLVITTVEIEPYFMRVGNSTRQVKYQGYIVDLVERLSNMVGFQFNIRPVADGLYGHRRSDGSWTGMIGEVVNKEADIAAAPIFITEHRERAVDFTVPYLDVQATILLRKPPNGEDSHVTSVTDLINQSEIKYGTLHTGLIIWEFKNTNITAYRIMWRNIQRFTPSVFTDSNEEGIRRVRREKYAYILPSTIGEYIAKRQPCDLITVDRFLMSRGYGLAVKKQSPLSEVLNKAIQELRQDGTLQRLYNKWWFSTSECNGVKSSKIYSVNGAASLTLFPTALFISLCMALH